MFNLITDIPRFALELNDHNKAKPDLRITIHNFHYNPNFKFIGIDLSLTNLSTSSFSISALKLNDKECLLKPIVSDVKQDGRRIIRSFSNELRTPFRVLEDTIILPVIDPIPISPYLNPKKSIRGLVFWDWDKTEVESLEISTIILSDDREISAQIPHPNKQ